MQAIRKTASYLFDNEEFLILLLAGVFVLTIPAISLNGIFVSIFSAVASITILWICIFTTQLITRINQHPPSPADSLFLMTCVSILITAASLFLISLSSISPIQNLLALGWILSQSLSYGFVFISLNQYIQTYQERLGKSSINVQFLSFSSAILFWAFIGTASFVVIVAGPFSGMLIGAMAMLVLAVASVANLAKTIQWSHSFHMKSIMASMKLGLIMGAIGDVAYVSSYAGSTITLRSIAVSIHILGLFFLLASCTSFQRWGDSPRGMVKWLHAAIKLIVSGATKFAGKIRRA